MTPSAFSPPYRRSRASTIVPDRPSPPSTVSDTFPEINDRDENGQTPLHVAASRGLSGVVKILLRDGADKEARDYKRQTPLHLAVSNGDVDTVLKLLGPGINATDKNGHTPLHVAARDGKRHIVQLLVDEGADMDANATDSRTPLHVAATRGKTDVVKVLVREGANRSARDNNGQIPLHLAPDPATASELLNRNVSKVPPPKTAADYQLYARKFVNSHLSKFPDFGDTHMKKLAQKASVRAKEAATKWNLSDETAAGLIKLALYDFVLLCDDSSSMDQADRKHTLENTLRQVATLASVLEPTGISVRFINHPTDDTFNKIVDVGQIMEKVKMVGFRGDTKLGTMLDSKIVQPMIMQKAETCTLKKPVIVPSENPTIIRDTILKCKTSPAVQAYGDAGVVFLISQVGDSPDATDFLQDLERDRSLRGRVYCSTKRLDDLNRKVRGAESDTTYIAQLPASELPKARLVCVEFDYLLQPEVFRHISINLHYSPLRSILGNAQMNKFLRDYDPVGLPSCQFTQFLDIDRYYPWRSYATEFGEGYEHEKADDLIEIISRLENLYGVNWVLGPEIHQNVRQGVMDAITSLDNLREFRFTFLSQPPLFNDIRRLTKLEVYSNVSLPTTYQVVGQLQQVIGSSPGLRYLGVGFCLEHIKGVNLPLLDLFRLVPESRTLPLEHLAIKGAWGLVLDKYFYNHIRGIQTLDLGHIDAAADFGTPNADLLWNGLRRHRILLKHIRVARASKATVEYMASYSDTIEEFRCGRDLAGLDGQHEIPYMFVTRVIPPHFHSLEIIRIAIDDD
ncbi:hypothetical protein FGG08_004388 [Glutinoglossum americanum]|uniref:Uncharacterized protein n=1 Tax=Glutinoglossum americanum TaxID=1670608 RepID=A0A9P8L2S3_9PEZI|nr:hypothetical protein FGG08_004388 [Glutinoglossum americanum]